MDDLDRPISDKFYNAGSTLELRCIITHLPILYTILWKQGNKTLNYDTSRGGIRSVSSIFLFFFQTLMRCPSPCLTSLTHFLIIAPVAFACLLFMHATFHIIDNSPNLCVLTLPSTSSKGLSWNLRLRFQMVKALRKIMKLNFGHFLWSPHSQIPLDWFMRGAP